MAEQTAGRAIGEIFAQMIDYRKANKDKIEDFIIRTSLAELDPAVRKARQEEYNRLISAQTRLDQDATDAMEGKQRTFRDLNKAFTTASGKVESAEITAIGKQAAAVISGQASVANSLNSALASVANAKIAAASAKDRSDAERDERIMKEVRGDLDEIEKGETERLDETYKILDAEGMTSPNAPTYTRVEDEESFKTFMSELWRRKYAALYDSAKNATQKKALLDEFNRNGARVLQHPSVNGEGFIQDKSAEALTEMVASSIGLQTKDMVYDLTSVLDQAAEERGYKGPQKPSWDKYGFTPRGGPSKADIVYVDKSPETLPIYKQLGLASEAEIPTFVKRGAYNRYLVDRSENPLLAKEPQLSYEEFLKQTEIEGSVGKSYFDYMNTAGVEEKYIYGDRGFVDVLIRRNQGRQALEQARGDLTRVPTIPSPQEINRRTLEAYSEIYGDKGQQRLVRLAEYGRNNPIVFKDEKGEEKTAYLDAPELEFLLSGKVEGKAQGGPQRQRPTGPIGVDRTGRIGRGIPKSPGAPTIPFVSRTIPSDLSPQAQTLVEQVADVVDSKARLRTEEDKNRRQLAESMRQELPPVGVPTPAELEALLGEKPEPVEQSRYKKIEPSTAPTAEETKALLDFIKKPPPPPPSTDDVDVEALTKPEEFDAAGTQLTQRAQKLQAELQLAETPAEQQSIAEQLARVSEQARKLIVKDERNPITQEDFDTLTEEEVVAKATKSFKRPEAKPSPEVIKMREDFFIQGNGRVAAREALQEKEKTGKEAKPEDFVPQKENIPQRAVAFLKDLANKKGRISAEELNKAVVAVLGEKATPKQIATAKSIYLAYEQIA